MSMYVIAHFIGFIIRQFLLPNPFEAMWPEQAVILNWVLGLVLLPISYAITGIWYKRGDGAATGSILFNIVYIVLSLALWGIMEIIKIISDNPVLSAIIIAVILIAIIALVLIVRIKKKKVKEI